MARRTSTARVREPAVVIDLAEARSRRASRTVSSAAARATVATCAITAPVLRLPVTPPPAAKPTQPAKPKKPRVGVRQRFAELRTALADGWEIVQPIFARPLWSVVDDSATAFNFVLRREDDTRLITVPEGRTVERFIRDRHLTVDYRR